MDNSLFPPEDEILWCTKNNNSIKKSVLIKRILQLNEPSNHYFFILKNRKENKINNKNKKINFRDFIKINYKDYKEHTEHIVNDLIDFIDHCCIDYLNYQNKKGYTALILATYYNHIRIVKALLKRGVNLDLQTHNGYTALMMIVDNNNNNNINIIKLLVEYDADLNLQQEDG